MKIITEHADWGEGLAPVRSLMGKKREEEPLPDVEAVSPRGLSFMRKHYLLIHMFCFLLRVHLLPCVPHSP